VTRLELRRRLDDRLRETSADLWPTVGERKHVVDRVSQGYRADARKHQWLVQEQAGSVCRRAGVRRPSIPEQGLPRPA